MSNLGSKKDYTGDIAQIIELAEESKDTREIITVLSSGT